MLKLKNVVYSYENNKVLDNINLQINEGENIVIIGPSGCGKTTLLYNIAGILVPNSGSIEFNNESIFKHIIKIGIILQNHSLYPWKTVFENIALGLRIKKVNKNDVKKEVTSMAKLLKITKHLDKYPSQLSGGERQRASIGRVLITNPRILLMDEPFSANDEITREKLQNQLLEIFSISNMTTVLVTHNIEEAVYLGSKIIIMDGNNNFRNIFYNSFFDKKNKKRDMIFYENCFKVRKLLGEYK